MKKRLTTRLLGFTLVAAFALSMVGCNATVGVGVSVPVYGPYHGPWGWGPPGGVWVGMPIYP